MKHLKDIIIEKLQTESKVMENNFSPKDKDELRKLIKQLLDERGKDADLNDIDVSKITDMSKLFFELDPHNIDISKWDVSNVKNMDRIFYGCEKFNSDLSGWNVSKVESMEYSFFGCYVFNTNLNEWNVSNVKNMFSAFSACNKLESDFSKWDVSNVENMGNLFSACFSLNPDLSKWNVSRVKDMGHMFRACKSFEGIGLEKWNVSNVKDMQQMFADCKKFNSDISKWNIDKKCNVDKMFRRYPDREKIIKTTPEIIHDSNKPKGSNGGFIWYRMWKYLNENGATKKRKVISDLQLKTYSYAALIDELDSSNIIILKPNDDLVAIPQNEWCKPIF